MNQKPRILVSACLGFCKCRYDGSVIADQTVASLMPFVDFVTVCPEMGIGRPSPREAIRLIKVDGNEFLVDSYTGTDRTVAMKDFIETFFANHSETSFDGVILKCKSPTCGLKDVKIYSSAGKLPNLPEKTIGMFGRSILSTFKNIPVEDDGRLKHFNIREQFFMSVFLHHHFRKIEDEVLQTHKINALIEFHASNKYLFMAYNGTTLKTLGKIVANHEQRPLAEVLTLYENNLVALYTSQPSIGKNVNTLLHLFGYFKNDLSPEEKAFFLDQLNLYQNKKLPFSSPLTLLKSWVVRFDEPYLKKQTLFDRFPLALVELTDSGKGL